MNKAKQLIIALMCGYDKDHDLVKTALTDGAQISRNLLETTVITKNDLLSLTESGDCFLKHKKTWENLSKLIEYFQTTGDPLTGADLTKPIGGDKTAMQYAQENSAADSLLREPSLWAGNFTGWQDAWFRVHKGKDDQKPFVAIKRAILEAEGKGEIPREDQLAAMGITWDELQKAIDSGDYKAINQKFAAGGDHLRREDIFLLDWAGDHLLYNKAAWEHAKELWTQLAKNGEGLRVEDFAFKCAGRDSPVERALSASLASKIFDYELWHDRPLSDVMAVYAMIPEDKRKDVKIEPLLDKMAERFFWERVGDGAKLTRADLVEPMDSKLHSEFGVAVVRPLGFESVLAQLDACQEVMRRNGGGIGLEDLRQVSGADQDTVLMLAARYNHFDKVLSVLASNGERLSLADLTKPGKDGKSIIEQLSKHGALEQILQPQDWIGRGDELGQLWKAMRQALPTKVTDDLDFTALQGKVSLLTVRQRFAGFPRPGAPAP